MLQNGELPAPNEKRGEMVPSGRAGVCCVTPLLFVLEHDPLNTNMKFTTFSEWLTRRDEGYLSPDRPPLKAMPRINTTPFTDTERKQFQAKPPKPPNPFAPTVHKVAEIVPQKAVAKLGPLPVTRKLFDIPRLTK